MFTLLRSASNFRSRLFDLSPSDSTKYEAALDFGFEKPTHPPAVSGGLKSNIHPNSNNNHNKTRDLTASDLPNCLDSYDWAFSFRENEKSDSKLVLEVAIERVPKSSPVEQQQQEQHQQSRGQPEEEEEEEEESYYYDEKGDMTLLHGTSASMGRGGSTATRGFVETADLISEEEQNMILAAIIASQNDFDEQIPRHVRDEMEHAELLVAMEESERMQNEAKVSAESSAAAAARTRQLEEEEHRQQKERERLQNLRNAPPTPSSSTFSPLSRRDSSIPWTQREGETVPGETEAQQRFRELLQMQAVAAASVANASAGRFGSNISGENDHEGGDGYEWAGQHH